MDWWQRALLCVIIPDTYINLKVEAPFNDTFLWAPLLLTGLKAAFLIIVGWLLTRNSVKERQSMFWLAIVVTWILSSCLWALAIIASPLIFSEAADPLYRLLSFRPDESGLACLLWAKTLNGSCVEGGSALFYFVLTLLYATLAMAGLLMILSTLFKSKFSFNSLAAWPYLAGLLTYCIVNGFHAWFIRL
jgi:hypothetical protein